MTTAATSLLGLALPVTGELSGTWGDTVNNSITALLDSAVAGTTTLSADADVTLTTTTLAANQAREAIILWTAAGTVTRYITAPAQSKIYAVLNKSSTQSIVLRGVGPTTGVTILAGKQAMVAWDGTDYVEISSGYVDGPATSTDNAVARFDGTDGKLLQNSVVIIADTTGNMTGVGTLSSGAITSSSLTATRVLFAGTSGLIQDDADLTFNGTILTSTGFAGPLNGTVGATTPAAGSFTTVANSGGERFTAAGLEYARIQLNSSTAALELMAGSTTTAGISLASNVATFLNNPVLTGGTANGVAYLDGSKVLTSGTALTFNGTTFGVTGSITASGTLSGTGTNTWTLQSVGASGSLVAGGWLYGGNEGFNLSPNGSGLTKRLTISYFTGAAYSEALGISNVNTGPNTGILSLLNNVALVTSSGLEVTQSQLIGYSSYSGLGSYGLAVAGNVGIGTASPVALLHLSSGNGTKAIWGTTRSFTVNRNWQVAVDEYAEGQFTITPSTTLGGTTFTTPAIRIDSAGNLGLGVTPSAWFGNRKSFQVGLGGSIAGAANYFTELRSNSYLDSGAVERYISSNAASYYYLGGGTHAWFRSTSTPVIGNDPVFTQAMTLDASGNLIVGYTSAGAFDANNFSYAPSIKAIDVNHATGSASGSLYARFNYAGSTIGSITQSGTAAVLYNVTSDQRLKENIQDAAPASTLIDSLQVRQYDWKSAGSHQRYGFVAQELVTVVPEAVHQPADPEEMMAVDYSKLVPMLVKEIQDLRKRLAAAGI